MSARAPSTEVPPPPFLPMHRQMKDLLRRGVLTCVALLSCLTFTNLQYVQRTVDSLDIETLPYLFSVNHHYRVSHYYSTGKNTSTTIQLASTAEFSDAVDYEDTLPCLVHETVQVNASAKRVSDANQTVLISTPAPRCGRLRRKWLYNAPISRLALQLENHQANCSLPLATHYFDNTYGLGAHFILWGQAMCNAMRPSTAAGDVEDAPKERYRMESRSPDTWLWLDQAYCLLPTSDPEESPLACYFPKAESRCKVQDGVAIRSRRDLSREGSMTGAYNVSDPRHKKLHCDLVQQGPESLAEFRAAATEYLFQQVSPLVIQEAKRQAGILFPHGVVPSDLITVHIRWGDKFWEMDLPPVEEYIEAVHNLTKHQRSSNVSIYLATEDPKAYAAFLEAKPDAWAVFADITLSEINAFRPAKGNRASWATRNTKGRAGLVALGSLLVAMEANRYVLTTKSNWSTLMNHLRTNVIDPRCGNCTQSIDLRPGVYY